MIVALDLATRTGVAAGDPCGAPTAFTVTLGAHGDPHGHRFAAAMRMTKRLIDEHSPDLIALEAPVTGRREKAAVPYVLMGLRGAVLGTAAMFGVPVVDHDVRKIRKHFVGFNPTRKAGDPKEPVMARCRQLGWTFHTPDEADALALWDYACSMKRAEHGVMTAGGMFNAQQGDKGKDPSTSARRVRG